MAGTFTAVDLSKLPAPPVVEVVDYEDLLSEMLATLQQYDPQFTALVESDPAFKILEVCAYYRMLDRQRVNEAARAVMLAYAAGADLDNLGALLGVERKLITPANPETGAAAVMESDDELRRRIQMAPEGFSVAGPAGAYIFHTLGADPRVLDAAVDSPEPGEVVVSVLSRDGDGTASPDLVSVVAAALNADDVRPLTDRVTVQSAEVVDYVVDAELVTYPGPDAEVVVAEAVARLQRYVDESHRIGRTVTLSGLYAALHVEGVQDVHLTSPTASIATGARQAPHCTGITVTHGGTGE